jgi:RHS repeat-associated protein
LDGTTSLASYRYNGLGQRVQKDLAADSTAYVYSTDGQLLGEYQDDGTAIREYVYLNGEPLAQINGEGAGAEVLYLHTDHLGTPRRATDSSGVAVWSWDSDAFGAAAANEDVDGNGTLVTVPLRFPGQYYDQETGLHYNYFRYYDPQTGRYLTSDPIGLDGGLNTYAYVGGNPLIWSDSLGLAGSNVGNPRPPNNRSNRNRFGSLYGKPGTSGLNPTPELIRNRDAQKALDSVADMLDLGTQNTASFYPPDIPFTECRRWRCPNPPGMCPPFVDVIGPILVGPNNPCVCVEKRRRWQGRNWDGTPRP